MTHEGITGDLMMSSNCGCMHILVVLLSIASMTGCASKNEYYQVEPDAANCSSTQALIEEQSCQQSYYQEYSGYDLAIVEFTERGNSFSDQREDYVLNRIRDYADEDGVVVVTFVHGWKHNAKETDENLNSFKQNLERLAEDRATLKNRRLVGVFVGWRGASITIPYLDMVTFWDRKSVAEEVGKGGVTRLLLELNKIDAGNPMNVLVIVGHSFGGAIVVSAVSEILTEKITSDQTLGKPDSDGTPSRVRGIGDAVIVLNPAIEANQLLPLVESAISRTYSSMQSPVFVSMSTDDDVATHTAFPVGQTLGLLFTWHQHDLKRSHYYDRITGDKLLLREEHLDSTTVGNFAPFLTHRLTLDLSQQDTPVLRFNSCDEHPDECKPKGLTWLSGNPTLGPLPDKYPLYFIKTDRSIMKGHNDIFNPVIQSMMLAVIDDIVRGSLSDTHSTVLDRPEDLNTSFQHFLQKEKHQ